MLIHTYEIKGLTNIQVAEAQKKFGENKLYFKKENTFWDAVQRIFKEPMVLLLLATATIYFFTNKVGDGLFMFAAIVVVSAISLIQDYRSKNALQHLKKFTQPFCKVIREDSIQAIAIEWLVVGDILLVEEGSLISADAEIIHSNDFSVNESVLTGESLPVFKDATSVENTIFFGTTVVSGSAIAKIIAIGNATKLGIIGKNIESIKDEKTPFEIQINQFVKKMVWVGTLVFIGVWAIHFFYSKNIIESLLKALTLAMSILPEEIPVAFTTFMALGAWRLMKMGIVVKQMKTIETLGSATVICTDKTGTITENKMSLAKIFLLSTNQLYEPTNVNENEVTELIRLAMFASEQIPFDPMEAAIHNAYANMVTTNERQFFKMIHEYPLSGKPPMMTHLFEDQNGKRMIAAKGAPEAFFNICLLSPLQKKQINTALNTMAESGYRVLAIASAKHQGYSFPKLQTDFKFSFIGMIAFYDPPKKNIAQVLQHFYKAGIAVKIITGDNAATSVAIAKQIGCNNFERSISGDDLMKLTPTQLNETVINTNIFTRMFPEAKLKIINALKENNEIVAMTGDGVNDGPALKAAHIGIAMGKKGSEIAKDAATLILMEDDLSKMVDAIAMGRRIYTNLKKAIQYTISIHIPIILTVFVPLVLNWKFVTIFSPVHIIFLELIMGPTCSIIYENEPIEKNTMQQKPRPFSKHFFNTKELSTSIAQGLMISIGTLSTYLYAVHQNFNIDITRTMVFIVLISANIFLTLVNRSFYFSMLQTFNHKNNLVAIIIVITIAIAILLFYVKPFTHFFQFTHLTFYQLMYSITIGCLSVVWYEFIKWLKRKQLSK